MQKFERENRYVILKRSDIAKHLNSADKQALEVIQRKINVGRKFEAKMPIEAVVIEHDWPIYNEAWRLIEDYVTQKSSGNMDYIEFMNHTLCTYEGKYLVVLHAFLRQRDVNMMIQDLQLEGIVRRVKERVLTGTILTPEALKLMLVANSTSGFDWLRTSLKTTSELAYSTIHVWMTA